MALTPSLHVTPVLDLESTDLDCPRCAVGTLERLTVTLLSPGGVFSRRFLNCGACGRSAPDLPPAESRPAGGGA